MKYLFLDIESYYDSDYSLSKMTSAEYILDPRFECIMLGMAEGDGPVSVIPGPDIQKVLNSLDASNYTTITHNALFDKCILAWRYGFVPALMLDTLGMSRALLGHRLRSHKLAKVAEFLRLPPKGNFVENVKGLHFADFGYGQLERYKEYCAHDTDLCRQSFRILEPHFPASERYIMDLVLRAAVQPQLILDADMLTRHLDSVRERKRLLLDKCGVTKPELMSTQIFKEKLEELGIVVEDKPSPASVKRGDNPLVMIPALAKTDLFMKTLLEHPDEAVSTLAAARLGHKSTLEETRAERLLRIGALPWAQPSSMPVPLRYHGAHTSRLSGDWQMNMQNLPRGSALRSALVAPPGCQVIVTDLAQIEARIVGWLCGCTKLVNQFRNREDVYCAMATEIFGRVITKADKLERFIGKSAILGLGYGLGSDNFFVRVKQAAAAQGVALPEDVFTQDLAGKTVKIYREVYRQIPQFWYYLNKVIQHTFYGGASYTNPVVRFLRVRGQAVVVLPNDMCLVYSRPTVEDGEHWYWYGGEKHKIYGAKLLENIVQALARIIVMHAGLRLHKLGYRWCLQAHDELVFVIPDTDLEEALKVIHTEMVRPPSWALDLPLAADIGHGRNYGEAK
jgi:DNA polymerase